MENVIPKIIHYCWFGRNPLPKSAKKCIASWKEKLSNYQINEEMADAIVTFLQDREKQQELESYLKDHHYGNEDEARKLYFL